MKKFEYKVLQRSNFAAPFDEEINELGQEGWEIVGYTAYYNEIHVMHNIILKREII